MVTQGWGGESTVEIRLAQRKVTLDYLPLILISFWEAGQTQLDQIRNGVTAAPK